MEKGAWPGHTYTEADLDPVTYSTAQSAPAAPPPTAATKTFAEKAAFNFIKTQRPNFDIATICPPMVYGPPIHVVSGLEKLNAASADIYRLMNGSEKDVPPTQFCASADVRDVARAHRLAYESSNAAGQRYLITSGTYSYQMVCDIIRDKVPEARERTLVGKPGSGLGADVYGVDNAKAKRELGISFMGLEESIVDMARRLLELQKELRH